MGEHGGCTAEDRFHEVLYAEYEEGESVSIPQFYGIRDSLTLYKLKA